MECLREVSDQAASCPQCGAPVDRDWIDEFLSVGGFGRATGPEQEQRQLEMQAQFQRLPPQERTELMAAIGLRAQEQEAPRTQPARTDASTAEHRSEEPQATRNDVVRILGIVSLIVLVGTALIGVVGLVVALTSSGSQTAGTTASPPRGAVVPTVARPATPSGVPVGETVARGGWEVTVTSFTLWDGTNADYVQEFQTRGKFVIADVTIKNHMDKTSNFSKSDFELRSRDGRRFPPADVTESIEGGIWISRTVQPGQSVRSRVVFDVAPALQEFTLTALDIPFAVSLP